MNLLRHLGPLAMLLMAASATAATCDADTVRQAALAARDGPAGRYGSGLGLMIVARCGDSYVAQPVVSGNPALLMPSGTDRLAVQERPERQLAFRRAADGTIDALQPAGSDSWLPRRSAGEAEPVELLLAGKSTEAAARVDVAEAVALADVVRGRLPSRRPAVLAFLAALEPRAGDSAAFFEAYGRALASQGRFDAARSAFQHAAKLDPSRPGPAIGLRMSSDDDAAPEGWALPFPLAALLATPTAQEKAAVLADWRSRRLQVADVEEVRHKPWGDAGGRLVLLSYRLNGLRQYGLVVLPAKTAPGCCAVVVDIKGTTPDYAPLDTTRLQPRSLRELGPSARDVIVLLPGLRGERILFEGQTYDAEGDRRDGWDGAADDARAMLSAVLARYPSADARRACAFGHSRGATVAMLAAQRDERLRCVAAEAGPTDWFELMGEDGWPLHATVREGLRSRSRPGAIGGQFIERFLAPVIAGAWTLPQARHRMLASSPLYFADRLPPTLTLYGRDDASVPVRNGEALALSARPGLQVVIQPATGHDLDPMATPAEAGAFLRRQLGL